MTLRESPTEIGAGILALALPYSYNETEAQKGQLTENDIAGNQSQKTPCLTLSDSHSSALPLQTSLYTAHLALLPS